MTDHHRVIAEVTARASDEKANFQDEVLRLQQACREHEAERDRVSDELTSLQKRLAGLESFDGRLWEREVTSAPPPFLDTTQRKTRFVSVLNLKGGVGKTTLTANIGVGLARRGCRVLLVDLDFQGTLSRLCIDLEEARQLGLLGRSVQRLLAGGWDVAPRVRDLVQLVRGVPASDAGCCHLIFAEEELAEAELRAQGQWLLGGHADVRFLFRQAFHNKDACDGYDYVFFDCPPRLTTASVNALACSDHLLLPVVLEQGSVEAVPRTLRWLPRIPHVTRATLLDVIANRVEFWGKQPIRAQQTIFNYLPETLRRTGMSNPNVFFSMVRNNRAEVEDAANRGQIAATGDGGLQLFQAVVDEVERRTRL